MSLGLDVKLNIDSLSRYYNDFAFLLLIVNNTNNLTLKRINAFQ